jgi:hypothetical protein
MAHFAKLDDNNIVIDVNVVHNNELLVDGVESETKGIEFLTAWSGGYSNWKQTSFNGTIRKNFAGIGSTFDPIRDAFIAPKPFPSWVLNEETCQWEAPVPYPVDETAYLWDEEVHYRWDEPTLSWVEISA